MAAHAHGADEIVRLTGDCPLIDPAVVDAVITRRRHAGADYATNTAPPTFPDGLDVECFTRNLLDRATRLAMRAPEREHVTLWMRGPDGAGTQVNLQALADLSNLRLTVDYADDLQVVRNIVDALAPTDTFDLYDILRVLADHPQWLQGNPHARNEGLARSLAQEGMQT